MALIRCTEKARKVLARRYSFDEHAAPPSELAEWYCNVLTIERRRCALLTHARTLYSLLIPGFDRSTIDSFSQTFRRHLTLCLEWEGIPAPDAVARLAPEPDAFSRTRSRVILGSMTDSALLCRTYVAIGGGLARANLAEVARRLNEAPMSAIGMDRASRLLRGLLVQA